MITRIIEEIKECIDNECFIAALSLALTIPDVCGKAEYPELEDKNKKRYIKWFDTFVGAYEKPSDPYGSDMPYLNGEVLYTLRNSVLHQGTPNIDTSKVTEERCKVDEFILIISDVYDGGLSRVSYGKGLTITERMLQINLVNLCHKLCSVAKSYYEDNKDKFDFFQYQLKDVRHIYDKLFLGSDKQEVD